MRSPARLICLLQFVLAHFITGSLDCAAQQTQLNIPVSFINGHAQVPFDYRYNPAEDIRRAGVRSLNIYVANRGDTFDMQNLYYRETYSERGDNVPYDRNYGNSEGFNQIHYNSDHTIATMQYVEHWVAGCGTSTTFMSAKRYVDYEYNKSRRIRETSGIIDAQGRHATMIKECSYDEKGRKIFEAARSPNGDTSVGTKYADNFLHTYDQRGHLLYSFRIVKAFSKKPADSLAMLPPFLAYAILRQAHPSRDSMLNRQFPGFDTVDDEQVNAQVELQDSIDEEIIGLYTDRAQGLVACSYDEHGDITGRRQFEGDDPGRSDTLIYDARHRLTRWETDYIGRGGAGGFPTWQYYYYSQPAKTVWTFDYGTGDRVERCSLYHYEFADKDSIQSLQLRKEYHYLFSYGPNGMVRQIAEQNERPYDAYFTAEMNDEKVRKGNSRYLIQYKTD